MSIETKVKRAARAARIYLRTHELRSQGHSQQAIAQILTDESGRDYSQQYVSCLLQERVTDRKAIEMVAGVAA
ncbi:MAG: hypothetical protein MJH10_15310 [Epibacterium sp.]|nr:hypothetical protein [Epibacterium sp.]NQX74888.1 hypothetical protein [Epibacterium sp.]